MLRDIVSKQYESVMSQIRFLEADRFSNSERINRGFDRLLNLQEAMDAIDYQESRGMKWDANIWHIKQEGKWEFNDLGPKKAKDFLDDMQNLVTNWLVTHGFSVGISDLIADATTYTIDFTDTNYGTGKNFFSVCTHASILLERYRIF